LDDVLTGNQKSWRRPPVLVTFDDAYASVFDTAAPVCRNHGVPAVFFINASCIGNRILALDNLICYVANTDGLTAVNAAAAKFRPSTFVRGYSLSQVFAEFLPDLSPAERKAFQAELIAGSGLNPAELSRDAALYVTSEQVAELSRSGFEIGDHTFSHIHCRTLEQSDLEGEVDRNRSVLEEIVGRKVRAFSVPYGSSADLTPALTNHLRRSGYQASFLSESLPNRFPMDFYRLSRVSVHSRSDRELFVDLEVLPYIRALRNRLFRRPIKQRIMG
jgi:peptidoglycan/xylan/chitin deacetylase (PgdA/CDA1 family)